MTPPWAGARSRWAGLALLVLVLLSTGRSLANGFAFDDVPIILENDQVHRVAPPWEYARQSYWPPRAMGDAYRPWTIQWLAIEWAAGGGSPVAFHAVNLVLAAGCVFLIWALAGALLPAFPAFAAAAVFAIHPVHVEATANGVGQAELWMTGFVLLGCLVYLRARGVRTGRSLAPATRDRLLLALLLVLAAASKEQGIVMPGLLLVLELVIDRETPLRVKARRLAPTFLLLGLTGVAFVLWRYLVLGDLGGGPPAEGIAGLGFARRAVVMLPLFLHWARLLVWPAVLRAQYSPPEFAGTAEWTAAAGAGLVLVVGLPLVALAVRRACPVVTAGIAWAAVASSIVSNLPFPTGILIAERTLFLPSVGVALVAGAAAAILNRNLVVTGLGVLLALGAARSWSRQAVWRDNPTLFAQTIADTPRSYRAWYVSGKQLQRDGRPAAAAAMYRRAAALYTGDPRVFEEWGQVLRIAGRCDEAIPVLEDGVRYHPTSTLARSRLFECLLTRGRLGEARRVAEAGVALGLPEFKGSLDRVAKREGIKG